MRICFSILWSTSRLKKDKILIFIIFFHCGECCLFVTRQGWCYLRIINPLKTAHTSMCGWQHHFHVVPSRGNILFRFHNNYQSQVGIIVGITNERWWLAYMSVGVPIWALVYLYEHWWLTYMKVGDLYERWCTYMNVGVPIWTLVHLYDRWCT